MSACGYTKPFDYIIISARVRLCEIPQLHPCWSQARSLASDIEGEQGTPLNLPDEMFSEMIKLALRLLGLIDEEDADVLTRYEEAISRVDSFKAAAAVLDEKITVVMQFSHSHLCIHRTTCVFSSVLKRYQLISFGKYNRTFHHYRIRQIQRAPPFDASA